MALPPDCRLTPDGSVVTEKGDVLFFSMERFMRDICEGGGCFICGRSPERTEFNDEHVIPEWVLRELNLFSKTLSLPNGVSFSYDRYKVSCCVRCNSLLGEVVEQPVSNILKGGMRVLMEHLDRNGPWLLFRWLALIFFKTHLRDRTFQWHLDKRRGPFPISEVYDWQELHHIHCIARSFFTHAKLGPHALGSFFALPASVAGPFEQFDYGDLYMARTVCLRFRDIVMVCVLNDSCACFSSETETGSFLARIRGPLSPLQIREVMVRLAYLNLRIKERPRFYSEFDGRSYRISSIHPDRIEFERGDPEVYGAFLYRACADQLQSFNNPDIETIKEHVRHGRYTFLFDQDGKFIREQIRFPPTEDGA